MAQHKKTNVTVDVMDEESLVVVEMVDEGYPRFKFTEHERSQEIKQAHEGMLGC